MEYILTLTFMTETGKKNSLTISGVIWQKTKSLKVQVFQLK